MPRQSGPSDGAVTDFTGVFVTRQAVDTDGTTVHELTFEDTEAETTRTVLVPASADCSVYGLRTGQEYEITAVRYCVPPTRASRSEETCPQCETPLRHAVAVDAEPATLRRAVAELAPEEPFTVATDRTRISRTDRETVDDWIPMDVTSEEFGPAGDYVCENCETVFDDRDLRGRGAEGLRHGADDSADVLHDNAVEDAVAMEAPQAPAAETIGLAAGGAKDAANFRENIENGYTPQPGAISTEGLFYDYYFETGGHRPDTGALFAPRYAAGVSDHPVTGDTEYVLSVGLDSTLSPEDFERPRLDLVVVLDISGSMDSPFDQYYYDEHGRRREGETAGASERKIDAATRAVCALTEQLHEDDRLGCVLFNNRAHVAKPLRDIGSTDMHAIRGHIRDVSAGGGTNMEDGFAAAWDMLADAPSAPDSERRVMFMTDMMPNMGGTDESQLRRRIEQAAADGIHTTFLGIGLDENADLADALSDVRGANHYFVHSVTEFERRLGTEFEYMVSPLVYDLQLELDADGFEVEAVHGAPGNEGGDRLIHVNTLFPSPKSDGETRGGIVLVELDATGDSRDVDLVASWVERDGTTHSEQVAVELPGEGPTFDHSGVRKAAALARYAQALREWARDVHTRAASGAGVDDWIDPTAPAEQERESVRLTVPGDYARRFETMRSYLASEAEALDDESLVREVELLETLCEMADTETDGLLDRQGEGD